MRKFVFSLLLAIPFITAFSQEGEYKGKIGGKYAVVFSLQNMGKTGEKDNEFVLLGDYYYASKGPNNVIGLSGIWNKSNNSFIIYESYRSELVGEFNGKFTATGMEGVHTNYARNTKLNFKFNKTNSDYTEDSYYSQQKQNSHNVLKIMGIPISGTYNSFVSQLAKRKFKETNLGWEGKFNGEDVVLHISTTPISRTVYQVAVMYKQGLKKYQAVKKCETLRTIIARKYNTYFVYNENSDYHIVEDYFARIFNKNQLIGIININAYASFLSDYGVNIGYLNLKGLQLNNKEENQQNEYIDNSNF